MDKDVSTPNDEYSEMQPQWELVDALLEGTTAMRKAGKRYLPKFDSETPNDYEARLACATLVPVYGETIANMTGRVFAKPISVKDKPGTRVNAFLEDFDGLGHDFNEVAATWFCNALARGLHYGLVDQTHVPGAKTKADTIKAGQRSYVALIHPSKILGWILSDDGKKVLQVRISECYTEKDGEYHVKKLEQIRVLTPGAWETQRCTLKDGKKIWIVHEQGTMGTKEIPLVPLYTRQTGVMTARPPLENLAHLNLKHWTEQSDQDNSVRFARVRLGFFIGVDPKAETPANTSIFTCLPMGSDVKIVQGSAESVEVGQKALDALMVNMREAGAKLLYKEAASGKTDAEARDDAVAEQSALARMSKSLEDALDQVLAFMAELESERAGTVTVNGNFDVDYTPAQTMDIVAKLNLGGVAAKQTTFEEAKRRGILQTSRTWEQERALMETEMPSLGTGTGGEPDADVRQ
jgi:hypothetical protein